MLTGNVSEDPVTCALSDVKCLTVARVDQAINIEPELFDDFIGERQFCLPIEVQDEQAVTLPSLAGKRKEYRINTLIVRYGADFAGPDLRKKLSVDCEKHAAAEYERCDLYFPDMLRVI